MNTYRIFTRRILGLDTRVWRLMIILITLSLILLSYKIITKDTCVPFKIGVDKNHHADTFFFTGETIRFFSSNISEDISWDFNDKTTGIAKGSSVLHAFNEEGVYFVTARVDQGCEFGKMIYIKEQPEAGQQIAVATGDKIVGVASTLVGKTEEFISPILADSYYEWEVLKHPEMGIKTGEKASFSFTRADTYIIQLTLDRDRVKSFQKRLVVMDVPGKIILPEDAKPLRIEKRLEELQEEAEDAREEAKLRVDTSTLIPTAPPVVEETRAPVIMRVADDVFKGYLQKLVAGEMTEKEFDRYLCRGGTTAVVINGDNSHARTFSKFFQEYKGKTERTVIVVGRKKLITIKSVRLIKDEDDPKCINKIEVNH